jgi:hypothetical protein
LIQFAEMTSERLSSRIWLREDVGLISGSGLGHGREGDRVKKYVVELSEAEHAGID